MFIISRILWVIGDSFKTYVMKINSLSYLFALALIALTTYSCNDDEVVIPPEEEVITTATFTLTPQGGGNAVVMVWQDLDGEGANAPVITGGTLAANTTYTTSMTFLNETETPAEDVTLEVAEEDLAHQVFYASTISGVTVTYTHTDSAGNPLGLTTELTTGAAGSGNITVTLRHEPTKDGAGVAEGDITNAGGETDVEATYPVEVQ